MTALEREWGDSDCALKYVPLQQNQGVSVARNTGAEHSCGQYLSFLDDDDRLRKTKIEEQVAKLLETGADACCCYVSEQRPEWSKPYPRDVQTLINGFQPMRVATGRQMVHISSILTSREAWDRSGGFDPELRSFEDVDWIVRLAFEAHFCTVEEELVDYRFSPDGASVVHSIHDVGKRDYARHRSSRKLVARYCTTAEWKEDQWLDLVLKSYPERIKNLLCAGMRDEAEQLWEFAMKETSGDPVIKRLRRKILKAKLLALFGRAPKHPKHAALKLM